MESPSAHRIFYDAERQRLWLFGQRCHHGATGVLLTGVALVGLGANRLKSASLVVTLAATGSALIVHDWKDRQIWFERGWGTQP